jgi:alpha-tubulin suppressor-like RCC1 family protein
MATGNPSNYWKDDPIFGSIDLDDEYITDQWLVDQFVGNNLFTWGNDNLGQLGNGVPSVTALSYSSPIQVGSLTNWKQVAAGDSHTSAIKTDGTLWTWGWNNFGQLGNGTTVYYSSPIQVGSLTNWKQVSAGYIITSAIKTDGTLWTWGLNQYGELGNGTATPYSSPIQVGSLTNWKQVSCGASTIAAIKTDGTLWTWGWSNNGGLGNGTASASLNYSSPLQIGALTNWKQVSAGNAQTAAIKTDGTLWVWGSNNGGQLGNQNIINYSSPIQVGSLNNWKQVSVNGSATAAIKTDGTLWTCGYNIQISTPIGILGNGTGVSYSSPIQVGSLTNWKIVVFSGSQGTAGAIKTDGTLWTWGINASGQLGNGTNLRYSSPIQVGTLTNWKQVSGGNLGIHLAAITFADIT